MRHELFTAAARLGRLSQRHPDESQHADDVAEAVLAVGFAKGQDSIDHCLELYHVYGNAARKLRAMGSAALDLAYVARDGSTPISSRG